MLDYMLNFSNISYVRCLHVSLIINTFAAVIRSLYKRSNFFLSPFLLRIHIIVLPLGINFQF